MARRGREQRSGTSAGASTFVLVATSASALAAVGLVGTEQLHPQAGRSPSETALRAGAAAIEPPASVVLGPSGAAVGRPAPGTGSGSVVGSTAGSAVGSTAGSGSAADDPLAVGPLAAVAPSADRDLAAARASRGGEDPGTAGAVGDGAATRDVASPPAAVQPGPLPGPMPEPLPGPLPGPDTAADTPAVEDTVGELGAAPAPRTPGGTRLVRPGPRRPNARPQPTREAGTPTAPALPGQSGPESIGAPLVAPEPVPPPTPAPPPAPPRQSPRQRVPQPPREPAPPAVTPTSGQRPVPAPAPSLPSHDDRSSAPVGAALSTTGEHRRTPGWVRATRTRAQGAGSALSLTVVVVPAGLGTPGLRPTSSDLPVSHPQEGATG